MHLHEGHGDLGNAREETAGGVGVIELEERVNEAFLGVPDHGFVDHALKELDKLATIEEVYSKRMEDYEKRSWEKREMTKVSE